MTRSRFTLLGFLSLTLMLAGCGTKTLTIRSFDGKKQATVQVEVADSAVERTRGLMERTTLEADRGMLFVFPDPQMLSFWMKNTKMPLEILFFDAEGAFVNVIEMRPCTADPCPQYASEALSQYALEVNPGFREKEGIGVGWKLDLEGVKRISKPQ